MTIAVDTREAGPEVEDRHLAAFLEGGTEWFLDPIKTALLGPNAGYEVWIGHVPGVGTTQAVLPKPMGPPTLQEAIRRRREVVFTGQCPCGAIAGVRPDDSPSGNGIYIEHEDGCYAPDAERLAFEAGLMRGQS